MCPILLSCVCDTQVISNRDNRAGRIYHYWWHGRGCSYACGNEQGREGGNTVIVGTYRRLVKTFKEVRIGQIAMPGILPVIDGRGQVHRNCRRMTINTQVQNVCMEEGVDFVDMCIHFVGRDYFSMGEGLYHTVQGVAVLV